MVKYFIIFISLIINSLSLATDHNNPYYLMHKVVNETFMCITNDQDKIQHNADYLRVIIREKFLPFVHIKYSGALALGNYYDQCTPVQKENYFAAFKSYLEKIYGQILILYNHQTYQIAPEKIIKKNTNTVSIRLDIFNKKQPPIHLDVQWRKNSVSHHWQIYDIFVEGISMLTVKHNEWVPIIRNKGIDTLINKLCIDSQQPIKIIKNNV